jgi:hypothetical protein
MDRRFSVREVITAKVFEPLFWKVKQLPVLEQYRSFQASQWNDHESFQIRQKKKLAELLVHAAKNIPFYKQYASKLKIEDIYNDPYTGQSLKEKI